MDESLQFRVWPRHPMASLGHDFGFLDLGFGFRVSGFGDLAPGQRRGGGAIPAACRPPLQVERSRAASFPPCLRACAARSQRRGSAPRWAALPEPLCFKRLGFRRAPVVQEVLGFRRGSGRLLLNPTRAKWLQGSGFSRGGSVDSPDARFLRRTRSTSLSSFFTWAARSSFRSRVSGFGFRVSGFGVRVPGFGVRGYLGRALALRLARARHHHLGVITPPLV